MAAEHFLERKYHNFGYCGFSDIPYSKIRCQAFAKRLAVEGFGVSVYEKTQHNVKHSWEKEQNRLCRWLQAIPKPAAIFASIDERSRHVAEACKRLGAKVPEDVAILGVDDDALVCELSDPPLSSIAMSTVQGGYDAAQLIVTLINNKKAEQKEVLIRPTHITVRRSTDILAINDREVLDATRYIRNNANKPVQVEDVVKYIAVSRRTLEVKFQRAIGQTLHDQIKRARSDKISEILRTTNMSIQQIAQLLGYNNSNNLARYYKQATGKTCRDYRKQCGNASVESISSGDGTIE
jgi:LacI family transcriptional regulator